MAQRVPAARRHLVMIERLEVFANRKVRVVRARHQKLAGGGVLGHMEDEVAQMPARGVARGNGIIEALAGRPVRIEINLYLGRVVAGPNRLIAVEAREGARARNLAHQRIGRVVVRIDAAGARRNHADAAIRRAVAEIKQARRVRVEVLRKL